MPTTSTLSSGVTSSGITVGTGVHWDIYGTADGFKAPNLGDIYVFAGGVTNSTTLGFFGDEVVSAGGSAVSTTISNSGGQGEISGGVGIDTKVSSGGFEDVLQDGVTSFTTVFSMGSGIVSSGGVASDTTVSNGGYEYVSAGGTTRFATISRGGLEIVSSGGTASATTVSANGFQYISSGGSAVSTTLGIGGEEIVSFGGAASDARVGVGGLEIIEPGGSATGIDVAFGGTEQVAVGALVSGTDLLSGGAIDVPYLSYTGGGTVTLDPATDLLTVSVGGQEYAQNLTGTYTLAQFFLTQEDKGTGTVINYTPVSVVSAHVTSTGILDDGVIWDVSGTAISFQLLHSPAALNVFSGGIESGGHNVQGIETVFAGGTASSTEINGTAVLIVSSGGSAIDTNPSYSGMEIISDGGKGSDTDVDIFGREIISSGGTTTGTFVGEGGTEEISAGGTARFTTVSGAFDLGHVYGSGKQIVYAGGVASDTTVNYYGVEIVSSGGTVSDTTLSSGGKEVISSGGSATGTDLLSGGLIDLTFLAGGTASFDSSTDLLTVSNGGTTYTQTLTGTYSTVTFHTETDSGGTGTDVFVACYGAETLIRTDRGDRPIRDLAIGDRVVTRAGMVRPIKWIGRRSYDARFIRNNPEVLPILVKRNALGGGLPRRDLYLSPHHALWFAPDAPAAAPRGVLVPVEHLVNGVSILQPPPAEHVDYVHVELDSHDVILAEGLAAETFVDCDSRQMFHNAAEFAALYPGEEPPRWTFCAPRLEDAPEVEALWRRLASRAGMVLTAGALHGHLDAAGPGMVRGWARDGAFPDIPVVVEIVADGVVLGRIAANRYRQDLVKAGYGHGRYGFQFKLPVPLAPELPHRIVVRRVADGAVLTPDSLLLPSIGSQVRGVV